MQCAASIGGWMLYSASAHIGHSMAHVLGAQFHLVHGAACAYVLPTLLSKLATVSTEKIKYVGQLLGVIYSGNETTAEIGHKVSNAFQQYVQQLGLPPMPSYEISQAELTLLTQKIVQEPLAIFSPFPLEENEVQALLAEILQ